MITTLEWDDVLDYLRNNTLKYEQESNLKDLDIIRNIIEADDIIDWLEYNSVSSYEEEKILNALNHICEVDDDDYENINTMRLPVLNLYDKLKFETIKNLYNNLTLEQLQDIEKGITIKVI